MSSPALPRSLESSGFTLVEMVVALTLIGVLAAMTAVFLNAPMQSYFLSRQRLDLADSVELAMRHMDLELRQAVPNSVRIKTATSAIYIEFLATRASGRYRTAAGGPAGACAGGNQLAIGVADNCLTTLGTVVASTPIVAGDYLVVRNTGTGTADAYQNGNADGPNKSRITAYTGVLGTVPTQESRLRFNNWAFPTDASDHVFYVASGPVTYACDTTSGRLLRYSGYPITAVQATPPLGGVMSVMVANLGAGSCNQAQDDAANNALMQRIVSIPLSLSSSVPGQAVETASSIVQIPVSKAQ